MGFVTKERKPALGFVFILISIDTIGILWLMLCLWLRVSRLEGR
jgi:hypothetical protein